MEAGANIVILTPIYLGPITYIHSHLKLNNTLHSFIAMYNWL